MLRRIACTLVVLLMATGFSPDASAGKVGPEFQVNTTTTNYQVESSVAGLSNGGFVVTWSSIGTDADPKGDVYGQRYNGAGAPVGGEFLINSYTASYQLAPSVAALGNGKFVVTWFSDDQDGSFNGVYAQRFGGAGAPVGNEFQVNTYTASSQAASSVAALSGGGFVIAWHSDNQDHESGWGIYAQRYNSGGTPVGSEFQVNTHTPNSQMLPSVAGLSNGRFVIVWCSVGQDGSAFGIYGQRYKAAGAPVGNEFLVNTTTANWQRFPSVAPLGIGGGGFVVTWTSRGQDGSGDGIYAQRYNAVGAPLGGEFQVNTTTAGHQWNSSVARLNDGGFVVAWQSEDSGGVHDVYGQRYNAGGAPVGGEFKVNTLSTGNHDSPSVAKLSVAKLSNGGFVITWTSDYDIHGQRFSP